MKRFTIDVLSLFALCSFAFAQPLFDLLGRHGEFFVAHNSRLLEILLLAAIPSLALPASLAALEWAWERRFPTARRALHLALVGVLGAVVLLAPLDRVPWLTGLPAIGLTGLAAALFARMYARIEFVRSLLALLATTSVIFPALFVSNDNVRRATAPAAGGGAPSVEVQARNPVVLVIFDEFPLSSLLDRELEIDAEAFPNFAALARRSYWFRQATAVSPATTVAVPTILNGRFPVPNQLATSADHPETLFQVLADSHRIRAYESVTQLWPKSDFRVAAGTHGFRSLAVDSFVAGLHVWTPSAVRGWLPPINLNWGGFVADAASERDGRSEDLPSSLVPSHSFARDRYALMRDFVRGIRNDAAPTFHFLHILLPHFPWEFLPSGRRYGSVSTFSLSGTGIAGICPDEDRWCTSQSVVDQNYERHLLQVGFVDTVVGELVSQLESQGIFDETLLVITADHGVSFRAEGMRRAANAETLPDILPIPLFIKAPHQKEGATIDRNVEAIDILPTICDILDIELPWHLDGRSALDPSASARADKRYFPSPTKPDVVHFAASPAALAEAVRRKLETFPGGGPYRLGQSDPWLGRRVDTVGVAGASGLRVAIENESHFEQVDLDADFAPIFVKGHVTGGAEDGSEPGVLAIAVSGVLCARATPYREHTNRLAFFSLIPEECFRAGRNEIALYTIAGENDESRLLSVLTTGSSYRIVESSESSTLVAPDGETLAVRRGSSGGRIDSSNLVGDKVEIGGWAADLERLVRAEKIVVVVDGESIFTGAPYSKRVDVAAYAGSDRVLESGFAFSFPRSRLAGSDVRVFATFPDDRALELNYHEGYRWRRRADSALPSEDE